VSVVIAARLSQRIDPRYMIAVGLSLFAYSLWLTSHVTSEWGFWELLVPQLIRGLSLMLCIVPSVTLALTGFAAAELRYASGLFNLMRNLGGAIGIALVNSWLMDNARIQSLRFGEALGHLGDGANSAVAGLADRIGQLTPDQGQALLMANGLVHNVVARQALTIAFDDVFRLMAWLFIDRQS